MKIAFLFLIVSGINHEKIWLNFFNHHEDRSSIYIHSKYPMLSDSAFQQFEIPVKVPTTWKNTMNAQIELLREALKDEDNQKFVFLSETAIPLQSFDFVYETLMAHPKSQFEFWPNPNEDRNWGPTIPNEKALKNHQWVVLNRKHAELMAKDTEIINVITKVWFDNEHYPSIFLALKGLLHEVEPTNTTFVIWDAVGCTLPVEFLDLSSNDYTPRLIEAIKEKKYLFGRKFGRECNLDYLKPYLALDLSAP